MSQGSILKRTNKRKSWRLKWELPRGEDGKRRCEYKTFYGSKADARAALREILGQLDKKTYVERSRMTLTEWLEKWLRDDGRSRSAKTYERYAELLRLHVIPRIGTMKLQEVEPSDIKRVYTEMQYPLSPTNGDKPRRALSAQTALHTHRALSLALRSAVEDASLLAVNPAAKIKKKDRPKPVKELVVVLPAEKLTGLLAAMKHEESQPGYDAVEWPMYPISALAAGTGMRLGELLAMRLCDVDLNAKRITVSRSVEATKEHGLRIKPPKTNKPRTVPIPEQLVLIVRAVVSSLCDYWRQAGINLESPQEALLFPASRHEPFVPVAPVLASQRFVMRCRRYGVHGFSFHGLRHTHATLLIERGINVKVVSERLGHSKIGITMDTYAHVLPDMQAEAADVSGDILSSLDAAGTTGYKRQLESRIVEVVPQQVVDLTKRRVGRAVECGGLENR